MDILMKTTPAFLLMCLTVALAAVDVAIPAQVVRSDNGASIDNAMVTSETLDAVEYTIGDGPQAAASSLKRPLIRIITYGEVSDIDMAKAKGYANRNDHERAAQAFVQAAVVSPYWRNREECMVLAAESFAKANKGDDAIKALADLEAKTPRSTFLPRAYGIRVQLALAKGDRQAAEAAIVALAKFDAIRAVVAKADMMRTDKKPADSAKELKAIWGTSVKAGVINPSDPDAPNFETVGFALAVDFANAGDIAGANATWLAMCYAPISRAGQSKAHLALATSLTAASDKPTLLSAFDHAIMGGAIPGGDRGGAKKVAFKILEKFDKMPDMKTETVECRTYVNAL